MPTPPTMPAAASTAEPQHAARTSPRLGPGGAWVLLRGLMREHGHWGDFPERLGRALGASHVLTPDLPGNGLLHTHTSPARIADMVDACRAQVQDALGEHHGPVNVLSISMGGMLATAWAHRYPREVASLCLMASSMRPFSPVWQRLRPQQWSLILSLLFSGASDEAWERAILQMTTTSVDAAQALPHWLRIRRERPVSTRNALRQLLAAATFSAPRQSPVMPTLVLCGALDALVDPRCSQAIADAWHCPVHLHPDAGHDLPLDAPQWVIDQLLAWLPAA